MKTRVTQVAAIMIMVLSLTGAAAAQDTITLMFDDPVDGLQRFGYTPAPGELFEIVALVTASESSCAVEFIMTELSQLLPGVFKTNTTRYDNTPLDLGDNTVGEYLMTWYPCAPAGPVEMVRVQYAEFIAGSMQNDIVLSLRGFGPGDSRPSSFDGDMGYVDVYDQKVWLTTEPWSEYGMPDNEGLAGAIVLNPTWLPIATEGASVSAFKTRY